MLTEESIIVVACAVLLAVLAITGATCYGQQQKTQRECYREAAANGQPVLACR